MCYSAFCASCDYSCLALSTFQWPMFFSDLLQCASSGAQTSVDLYLRVLLTIDEEVVDRQIIHTQEVRNSMYWHIHRRLQNVLEVRRHIHLM